MSVTELLILNATNISSNGPPRLSDEWVFIFAIIFSSFTMIGTTGNVLVIVAVSTDRKMRASNMNLLLMNLAVADLGNLLSCMLEWAQVLWNRGPGWILPISILCPALRFCEIVCLFTSLLTQIIISIERFIAIVHPIHARRLCTREKIVWLAGAAWLFAALFTSPYAAYHQLDGRRCHLTLPAEHPNAWKVYKWAECLLFYFIPLVVMIALYTKVVLVLSTKDRMLQVNGDDHRRGAVQRRAAIQLRLGVVRMLVACVVVYFTFYSPIQAMFLAAAVFHYDIRPHYVVSFCLNALAIACSAANPLLYTLFSQRFRVKFAQMLCCIAVGDGRGGKTGGGGLALMATKVSLELTAGNSPPPGTRCSSSVGGGRVVVRVDSPNAAHQSGHKMSMRRKLTVRLRERQTELEMITASGEDVSACSSRTPSVLAAAIEEQHSAAAASGLRSYQSMNSCRAPPPCLDVSASLYSMNRIKTDEFTAV